MVEQYRALHEAGVPVELAFPRQEYQERVSKVKRAMEQEGIEVLLVQHLPNFCYLAGYQTPLSYWFGCFILPLEGEARAVIPLQEVDNLMVHGWDNENIDLFDWQNNRQAPSELADILRRHGLADKTLGIEESLPGWGAFTAQQFRELIPEVRIKDASDLVLNLRAVKSPAEIAYVREAARFTDIGMQAALDAIAPGRTDNEVAAAAYQAMVNAGSEYVSIQPLVYTGHVAGMLHVMPRRRTIDPGDMVHIELAGVYQRYSAPLIRTGSVGEPDEVIRQLEDYAMTALGLIGSNIWPGSGHQRSR